MKKQEVIDELEQILSETRLSPRAGKYEAGDKFQWFNTIGRARIRAVIERLKERCDGNSAGA
jgi:hypothetical protein